MRIGFGLPNIGPLGSPENIAQVAERAEALGYDSLWTIERLLWPLNPKTPYPVTPDGRLPDRGPDCAVWLHPRLCRCRDGHGQRDGGPAGRRRRPQDAGGHASAYAR